MERLEFDLCVVRWLVGRSIDPVWDHSVFSKNRDRLLAGVASRFLAAVLAEPRVPRAHDRPTA
jgi:hypothetical protein